MRNPTRGSVLPLLVLGSAGLLLAGDEPGSEITPFHRLAGSVPLLTDGFADWPLCTMESRVETLPPFFGVTHWGPASIEGASGCRSCGGARKFSGSPETAGLGIALAPPHDFSSDTGQLPPPGRDHAFVMATTGEVVYTETDFVIPGVGFDLRWTRTYRSAYEYDGEMGYGWDYSAQLFLYELSTGDVNAYLGTGRVNDRYIYDSQSGYYTSPEGFFDQLTKGTRPSNHPTFPNDPYFTKTEKNGVVWEFDLLYDGAKDVYGCTKIEDPFGNTITFAYGNVGLSTFYLDRITDTEGRDVTFTRSGGRITQVTVSNSAEGDYGNLTIDYTYTGNNLTKVERHYTRQSDGGSKVRPYTEYTYLSTGIYDEDLDLVKDCGTTVLDFDYSAYDTTIDRCTKVTGADSETYSYSHDQSDANDDWTEYTDPWGQQRDYVYEDLANDDRTVAKVREWLEDKDGNDLTSSTDTIITRNCDCGQITEIEYSDGSKELWSYDSYGNVTEYKRRSKNYPTDADLVKKWTYDSFANGCRMLTSSGWVRAESNPSAKVTWTWNADLTLQKVAWPSVTTGQPSSQTIEWSYTWYSDGRLKTVTQPAGERSEWTYSGNNTTRTDDPDTGGLQRAFLTERDVMGHVTAMQDPAQTSSYRWEYTVTPDGRVLKAEGPNGQETKFTYDLRGRKTKDDRLLVSGTSTRVETSYSVSAGGVVTEVKADSASGGLGASSTYEIDYTNRTTESLDPDDYGTRTTLGYGSYGLPWKIDNSNASTTYTLVKTLERGTMGRVTAEVLQDGRRVEHVYDGYGRRTRTKTDLPNSKQRETVLTLKAWGAVEKREVKVGTKVYASRLYYYDEANRLWKEIEEDPEETLADRVTQYERDANGRVAKRTDPRNSVWETQWDDVGRVSKTIEPAVNSGKNEVRYSYNDSTRTTTITHHDYDTDAQSYTDYVVEQVRDYSGRVTSVKDKGSGSVYRTVTYTYDEGDRRTKRTSDLGYETKWEYDALGWQTKETKPVDSDQVPALVAPTQIAYTLGGRRETVTDANGKKTKWEYNSFGQVTKVIYNQGGTDEDIYIYSYTDGRLDTITHPLGDTLAHAYDDGGRLVAITITKGSSGLIGPDRVVFVYDDMDRVTSGKTQASDGQGGYTDLTAVTRAYNGFGEMDSETQYGSRTFTFTHDAMGAVKKVSFPSGGPVMEVEYVYDAAGRVDEVKRKLSADVEGVGTPTLTSCATLEYAGHREIERVQSPYDLTRTQTWSTWREPVILKYEETSTSTLLTGLHCYWDDDGRMVVRERMHDDGGTKWGEVFRYDEMDRLVTMWRNVAGPASFTSTDPADATDTFDDKMEYVLGKVYERDKTKVTPDSGSTTTTEYTNNDFYQYTDVGGTAWTWDDNGQLTDNGGWAFSWTALGQLAEADPDTGTTREYLYDAFGRRVETTVGSAVSKYIYVGWHMVGEHDGTAWLWHEVPLPGEGMLEHVALDTNDLDGDQDTDEYRGYAVHEDYQDTVWGLSDTDGDLVERYRYREPYGDNYAEDGSDARVGDYASDAYEAKRLHGGVVSEALEVYDFRSRWLDPEVGGWRSRDPQGVSDSPNLYQAFWSRPLSVTDQSGSKIIPCPGAIGGEIGKGSCRVTVSVGFLETVLPWLWLRPWDKARERCQKQLEKAIKKNAAGRFKCAKCTQHQLGCPLFVHVLESDLKRALRDGSCRWWESGPPGPKRVTIECKSVPFAAIFECKDVHKQQ